MRQRVLQKASRLLLKPTMASKHVTCSLFGPPAGTFGTTPSAAPRTKSQGVRDTAHQTPPCPVREGRGRVRTRVPAKRQQRRVSWGTGDTRAAVRLRQMSPPKSRPINLESPCSPPLMQKSEDPPVIAIQIGIAPARGFLPPTNYAVAKPPRCDASRDTTMGDQIDTSQASSFTKSTPPFRFGRQTESNFPWQIALRRKPLACQPKNDNHSLYHDHLIPHAKLTSASFAIFVSAWILPIIVSRIFPTLVWSPSRLDSFSR